jgi:hypothetical protein
MVRSIVALRLVSSGWKITSNLPTQKNLAVSILFKIIVAFFLKITDKGLSRVERFVMFESNEEFSVEVERELWAGYEAWLEEQADRAEYERMMEI